MDLVLTFLEGIVTFVSPCLLPMLPLYLAYVAGAATGESASTRSTLVGVAGFVVGFSVVFCGMGALAGLAGSLLVRFGRALDVVCGILVVAMGLGYLGVVPMPALGAGNRVQAQTGGFVRSLAFGAVFAVSWTPCVGAFLASALGLAATSGGTARGVLLLLCYSLGLGLPFVASALLIDQLSRAFARIKRHFALIERVSGAFLVAMGVLMATGTLGAWLRLLS